MCGVFLWLIISDERIPKRFSELISQPSKRDDTKTKCDPGIDLNLFEAISEDPSSCKSKEDQAKQQSKNAMNAFPLLISFMLFFCGYFDFHRLKSTKEPLKAEIHITVTLLSQRSKKRVWKQELPGLRSQAGAWERGKSTTMHRGTNLKFSISSFKITKRRSRCPAQEEANLPSSWYWSVGAYRLSMHRNLIPDHRRFLFRRQKLLQFQHRSFQC